MFDVSIVRIKYARSTIGYSEAGWILLGDVLIGLPLIWSGGHQFLFCLCVDSWVLLLPTAPSQAHMVAGVVKVEMLFLRRNSILP
jgi:hypothetical protein